MASAQQSAVIYLRKTWGNLVSQMQNFPVIVENLYQRRVFNDYDVNAVKAKWRNSDKAKYILNRVINKGETASYELLKILDFTLKRTLSPRLHKWIKRYSFREDSEAIYSFGTKPCKDYQTQLKIKAKSVLENQREQRKTYLPNNQQENFHFIPLASEKEHMKTEICNSSDEEYVEIKDVDYSYLSSDEEYVEIDDADYAYLSSDEEYVEVKHLYFTPLFLKNPQCEIKSKKHRYRKRGAYIPNKEETVSPADLLKMQDKKILMIGQPGIGKTTVVQEMLRLWTEDNSTEPDYMFYFDESILTNSSKLIHLESLLFDVYAKAKEDDQQEVLQDMKDNSENVVFIFDGVTSVQEHSVLKKIMNHDVLRKAKIIITCRTEVEDDPLFSDWPNKKVYVQGFSEESIRTYYEKMLGHNPDLLNVVLNNQELFSLSYVPVNAFVIVNMIIYKNDMVLNHPHTITNMNMHIFFLALMKYGDKNFLQIDEYLTEIKDQLYLIMKNAFSTTEQKSLYLPEISGDQSDICSVFLKMITIRDSPTSAVTYCAFLHNTMQEFFSALWLLGNPDEIEKVLKLCQTEENKHMRYVLHFLFGLLGEHNIKLLKSLFPEDQMKKTSDWLIEKLLDAFLQPQNDDADIDLLYVCQCLYELQSSKACLMFLEKMNHQLDPDVNLDPHQCCALSYLISQSRDKEVYLNLEDCTVSDTGMKMILSCSPQIRLKPRSAAFNQIKILLQFFHKASIHKKPLQEDGRMTSQCCCNSFAFYNNKPELADALLDLYSHVKDYESQTGRSFIPALQPVFQSLPDVWSINLSKRKTSILLEVLKLQTEKKPVELRGWTDEESQVMSLLHCLPYISQLSFVNKNTSQQSTFLVKIFIIAAETKRLTGEQMLKLLTSVWNYRSICFDNVELCDFLLDLYSHAKDYETQTGRSLLPALQPLYHLVPYVWIIDFSKRKTSILLEVLKLQTEKKLVELIDWTDEESQVMSLLHCLPYISQLR